MVLLFQLTVASQHNSYHLDDSPFLNFKPINTYDMSTLIECSTWSIQLKGIFAIDYLIHLSNSHIYPTEPPRSNLQLKTAWLVLFDTV